MYIYIYLSLSASLSLCPCAIRQADRLATKTSGPSRIYLQTPTQFVKLIHTRHMNPQAGHMSNAPFPPIPTQSRQEQRLNYLCMYAYMRVCSTPSCVSDRFVCLSTYVLAYALHNWMSAGQVPSTAVRAYCRPQRLEGMHVPHHAVLVAEGSPVIAITGTQKIRQVFDATASASCRICWINTSE